MRAMIFRIGFVIWLSALACVLTLVGFGFAAAGLFLFLSERMPAPAAALGSGALLVAMALLIGLFGWTVLNVRFGTRRRDGSAPGGSRGSDDLASVAADAGKILGVVLQQRARPHLPLLALLSLGIGFMLGVSPRLRGALGLSLAPQKEHPSETARG